MRESLETGLASGWALVVTFVPKILFFAAILLIGYFVAKVLCKVINGVLEKVGFDRLVERGGIKRSLAKAGWDASDLVAKLAFYFVMLFALQMAFGVFGTNPVSQLLTDIVAYLPNILAAVIIVTLAAAIGAAIKQVVQVALGALSYGKFLGTAAGAMVLVVGVMAALNQLGIAPAIVNGLFYAMLATIVGCVVVAVGGGGIQPMRKRWESMLGKVEEEAPRIRNEIATAGPRVAAEKNRVKEHMRRARDGARRQHIEAAGYSSDGNGHPS